MIAVTEPNCNAGGFKVWEGALDLTLYLAQHESELQNRRRVPGEDNRDCDIRPFAGLHVLELGCGHALPGILALAKGASVDFQVPFEKEKSSIECVRTLGFHGACCSFHVHRIITQRY